MLMLFAHRRLKARFQSTEGISVSRTGLGKRTSVSRDLPQDPSYHTSLALKLLSVYLGVFNPVFSIHRGLKVAYNGQNTKTENDLFFFF